VQNVCGRNSACFLASAPQAGSVVFRVAPDEGADADPADNSVTVEVD
jgi:hypothetical protein